VKLADLSAEALETIKTWRFDRMIEKHEGPESWWSFFEWSDLELLELDDRTVLLPVEQERHPNISVVCGYASPDESSLTLFLKDTSLAEYFSSDDEMFWAGFLAICERLPGTDVYVAVVYHEWFMVQNAEPGGGDRASH